MRFAIFVIDSDTNTGGASEMVAIDAFNDMLRENGHWVMAFGMEKPGADSIQSTDEFYSGQWIIEAADLAEAQKLAAEGSKACNRRVELRPFL
jgi:hypothetical protein